MHQGYRTKKCEKIHVNIFARKGDIVPLHNSATVIFLIFQEATRNCPGPYLQFRKMSEFG